MRTDIIIIFIKLIGINISFSICFCKILNNYTQISKFKKFIMFLLNTSITILQTILYNNISTFLVFLPLIIIYGFLFSLLFKISTAQAFCVSIISLSISCIFALFSMGVFSAIYASVIILTNFNALNIEILYIALTFLMSSSIIIFVFLLFKVRKFKYGFTFLNNDFIKLQVLLLTIIMIFAYCFGSDFNRDNLFFTFIAVSVIALIIIKQVFNLYQKQKLQLQTLKDYEKELSDIKEELRITKEEKEKIIKSNHEFYHRQEALKNKLNTLLNNNYSTEMSNELTNITSRINNLSSEYEDKLKSSPKIDTCGIEEIDDMLTYFQNECNNNNIEFICKFDGNINKIINNVITLSQFETLLGDLIRNSIIAINHTSNENRNIMLVFGLKNEVYELDIYDSGVNFEIETLLKLGLEKCSTHLNEGGTGIGFITTFETLQNTKSSLIITEMNSGNYSKCIGIRFDGNSNYIIDSYRIDSIKAQNITSRKIMFQNSNK